jgi:cell division protein FtsB
MSLVHEVRRRARHAALPLLCAMAIGYFGYHAVQGERGLASWLRLTHEVERANVELAAIQREKQTIERRVALLTPTSLDRDMLDERARLVLGRARADEIVFLNP